MGSSRPCFHVNGQTEYSRLQDHALYLVGPARRSVLWTIKTDWNNPRRSVSNAIDAFAIEPSIERQTQYNERYDKVILQYDNAWSHVAKVVKTYLETLKWEVLPHPPYSPDVVLSDYHLFRSMAHGLADQYFRSYEEVKKLDRFVDSLKRWPVFSTRDSYATRKMGESSGQR